MTDSCLFCRIVSKQAPAALVFQDEHVTAFRDLRPKAPTHILVVPNKHITGMNEASGEDAEVMGRVMFAAARIARGEGLDGGYRLVVNSGPDAGQSVFHLHVHLLGGRHLHWPPG